MTKGYTAINRAVKHWNNSLADLRQEYEASRETRFVERPLGMHTHGAGADYSFRDETSFYYLLGVARNFEENDPIVGQGVERAVANIVQQGFRYEPQTGNDAIDSLLKERWQAYSADDNAEGTDWDREHCWHEFEKMSCRRIIFDGDVMIEPMTTGQLRTYEAHRMRSPSMSGFIGPTASQVRPNINLGVELPTNGQSRTRLAYWMTRDEFDGFGRFRFRRSDLKRIAARQLDPVTGAAERNLFHVFHPKRFSQTRGVTALAPVANAIGMHGDIQFAKLVQQQMVSYVGFIHEIPHSATDYEPPEPIDNVADPRTGRQRAYGPDLSPGSEYWPEYPDEKITGFSPNVPNPEFFDQAKMILTFVAVNLDLPLIIFLLDAGETNFSGFRGALDQAKLGFTKFQRALAARLHRPVIRFQQRRWLRQDRGLRSALSSLGADFFRHEWIFPRWPYIEPWKDVQADAQEIASVLNSPRRVVARRSLQWDQVVRESCEDVGLLIECAMEKSRELNEKYSDVIEKDPGERVRWREMFMRGTSQLQVIDPESTAAAREAQEQQPTREGANA